MVSIPLKFLEKRHFFWKDVSILTFLMAVSILESFLV